MKTRKFLIVILTLAVTVSAFTTPVMADESIKVTLNGSELVFDVPPQLINGRTMVPMRTIFEALGSEIDWDSGTQTITAEKDDVVIKMQIDNVVISVDGNEVALDVPPQLVGSRTLVPVRAVAESLNAEVEWDGPSQTVAITSDSMLTGTTVSFPVAEGASEQAGVSGYIGYLPSPGFSAEEGFACSAGAIINYGFGNMWNGTVGTGYTPYVRSVGKAYRYQAILIAPLYTGFAIDRDGMARVEFSVTIKKSDGEEDELVKGAVAFEGSAAPGQVIKASPTFEYSLDSADPLGVYTFTIESKDVVGNKAITNTFQVEFSDYAYNKNEFKSDEEFFGFVYNYSRDPKPDRIIDAIIYAENKGVVLFPIMQTAFSEMLTKNEYVIEPAVESLKREFGENLTETLKTLVRNVDAYIEKILANNPPSLTYVEVPAYSGGSIMQFSGCVGVYLTSGSYAAAKELAVIYSENKFTNTELGYFMAPTLEELVELDPLMRGYCTYMLLYDNAVSQSIKGELGPLINPK